MNAFRYNFVFFYARDDFSYLMLGNELLRHPQVHVYKYAFDGGKIEQLLYRVHTAYKINKRLDLPLKAIWFKKMYEQRFDNDNPICFVFLGGNMLRFDGGFCKYVRKRDSRNRIVMLHWDLISKKINYDYNDILKKVDLAITYDKDEAEQYGIHYFQETPYSVIDDIPTEAEIKQDVYFLGAAKDRLKKIYEVYYYLRQHNISCKFLIAGVPFKEQIKEEGIEYIKRISYKENIANVINSKCILELVQKGSSDITLRTKEAIAYGKRLITDCTVDVNTFFNKGQLIQFNEVSQIDVEGVKAELPKKGYPILLDMNPLRRLYDIQEQLEKIDEESINKCHCSGI